MCELHVWRNWLRGGLSDLDLTGLRPLLATRHTRYVLFVNSLNKLNNAFVVIDLIKCIAPNIVLKGNVLCHVLNDNTKFVAMSQKMKHLLFISCVL